MKYEYVVWCKSEIEGFVTERRAGNDASPAEQLRVARIALRVLSALYSLRLHPQSSEARSMTLSGIRNLTRNNLQAIF